MNKRNNEVKVLGNKIMLRVQNSAHIEITVNNIFLTVEKYKLLVSTSLPKSFGVFDKIKINEREYDKIGDKFFGLTPKKLSDAEGFRVDGAIGLDIIKDFAIMFNLKSKDKGEMEFREKIEAYTEKADIESEVSIDRDRGIFPVCEAEIYSEEDKEWRRKLMFFDIGAGISYLETEELSKLAKEELEEYEDYYADYGRFKTRTYLIRTKIGGKEFNLRYGRLPAGLGDHLKKVTKKDGVIGNELIRGRRSILSLKEKRLVFVK